MEYEFLIGTFFVFCGFFVWLIILTVIILKIRIEFTILQDNVKNLYEISHKQTNLIHEQNEILLNLATDKKDEVIYFDEMTLKKNPTYKPHHSTTQKRDSRGRFAR